MAPKKRKEPEPPTPKSRVTRAMARYNTRVTRSTSASGSIPLISLEDLPLKKRRRTTKGESSASASGSRAHNDEQPPLADDSKDNVTIIIEHCESESFKATAEEAKARLENRVPGIVVTLNPVKPRKNCFEIREEGGEKFISFLKLKAPFKDLMELDMEKVITDIAEKLASKAN